MGRRGLAKKDSIVAVEVMNNGIRAAEISGYLTQRPKLLRYGFMPLAEGVAEDGAVIDSEKMGRLLKSLWNKSGFESRDVALGISSRSVMVKEQKLPNIPEKKLRQSLHLEVAESLSNQGGDGSVLDFYPIEKTPGENSITSLILSVKQENIEKMIVPFMFADLNIEYVDYSPFGLAVSSRKAMGDEGNYITVNINSKSSEIIVVSRGLIRLARIVPYGIMITPQPEEDEFGDYIYSTPMTEPEDNDAEQVLSAIDSTIRFYESGRREEIESVLMTGEGTASSFLRKRVKSALMKDVSFLDLNTVIGEASDQEDGKQSSFIESCLLSTVGIGMRGLK